MKKQQRGDAGNPGFFENRSYRAISQEPQFINVVTSNKVIGAI